MISATPESVHASRTAINCSKRNGFISSYAVKFHETGETTDHFLVMGREFNATGLTPRTNYTFRVAGVNSNGTGPFSNSITIVTDEDSKLNKYTR